MEQFLTWEMLLDYVVFVNIVFSIVAVTKKLPLIKLIPTRGWSIIVAFTMLTLVQMHAGTFELWGLLLNFINGIMISLTANALADINKGGDKK